MAKLDTAHVRNVGEFYSQHYLDAVLADDLEEILAGWTASETAGGARAPYKRLAALAEPWFKALAEYAGEDDHERRSGLCAEFHARLLDALGYARAPSRALMPDGRELPRTLAIDHQGRPHLWVVEARFPTSEDDADPLGAPPLDSEGDFAPAAIHTAIMNTSDEPPATTWRELLDGPLLRQDHAPRWVLLLAGPDVFLIDRDKWALGQYLHFELGAMLGHRRPAALRAAAALLHREVLAPEGGQSLLDRLDERSHKHAFAVSTDLKLGVQQAIELIGDEAVWYKREVSREKVFDRPELAAELARECITYLYRLLFLFYVEARGGEVGVVPMKAEAYRHGLSLESLRDLELVPLTTDRARNGFYLHHSLEQLFRVVHLGWPHTRHRQRDLKAQLATAVDLTVPPQRSPLFDRARTPILSSVKLRNHVLQQVIALLSLSKEGSRAGGHRQRGRISYAQLGINQLGAVYEGLLSYTGFFAQEETYELQSEADDEGDARVFYVPRSRIGEYEDSEFRKTATGAKVVHPKGSFLFRLAGRDRQKSASYYTPEVLTRCLTKYTLKERLGAPGSPEALSADAILELTVCEPAMGSGAFLNEAVSQLAHAYLERKQAETGLLIAADAYQREFARVKYHFVNHRCYGVDLNPLAAELGKVSLWLGVLQPEVQAPFLDARVRVGNSLIGARREVYTSADLTTKPNKKTGTLNWLGKPPTRLAPGQPRPPGAIYHFLVPDEGMSAYASDKVVAALCPKEIAALKAWHKANAQPFTPMEIRRLEAACESIDALWAEHRIVREKFLTTIRQPIHLWGQPEPTRTADDVKPRWRTVEECEPAARELFDAKRSSPGARLKAVMDYWCSLWSWPVENLINNKSTGLPSRDTWLAHIESLLKFGPTPEQAQLDEHRFFHWELEFPEIFNKARGGFDIILGNPPWIKLSWEEGGILGDLEPLLAVRKLTATAVGDRRAQLMKNAANRSLYLREFSRDSGAQSFLNAPSNYPLLEGVQTNLYKCFLSLGTNSSNAEGTLGLLHQPGVYDDPRGGALRAHLFPRSRLIARFKNSLSLFSDVHHLTQYCVSVFSNKWTKHLTLSVNLLHPATLDGCFEHDGLGPIPGIKDENGKWDLRSHRSRLVQVDDEALALFARLYDPPGTPAAEARLPVVHSQEILSALKRFAGSPRLSDLGDSWFSVYDHLDESRQQKDGTIARNTSLPKNPAEWILQGPHFYVGNPFNKTPNEGCKHNQDYKSLELTELSESYLPRTNYTRACSPSEFRKRTPEWEGQPVTSYFRHVHREMVSPTGERTLVPALIPSGPAHVNTVLSIMFLDESRLLDFSGMAHSIVADFFIKSTGMGHVNKSLAEQLPYATGPAVHAVRARTLQLNCLTNHYADLWNRNLPKKKDLLPSANAADPRCAGWEKAPRTWTWAAPLRTHYARRQALVELDALAALSLNMTLEELQLIYRVQFPVLQQYERETYYDRRGKIVFTVNKGLSGVGLDRKQWDLIKDAKKGEPLPEWAADAGGPFEPPFNRCDREEDMARAYAYFKNALDIA